MDKVCVGVFQTHSLFAIATLCQIIMTSVPYVSCYVCIRRRSQTPTQPENVAPQLSSQSVFSVYDDIAENDSQMNDRYTHLKIEPYQRLNRSTMNTEFV